MEITIVGKADRNRSVEEVINDRPRSGADYLDLATGNLVKIAEDEPAAESQKKAKKGK